MTMIRLFMAIALTGSVLTGGSAATRLTPGSGHSIRLGAFEGVVYYTVEQDDYRVVATLGSGADAAPLRVISTLAPGQRVVISVPRSAGEPSLDFEILRNGDAILVNDAISTKADGFTDEAAAPAALEE
jgi:hypothetical protein